MQNWSKHWHLPAEDLERILEVTRKLAAPFDLTVMLREVVDAARGILDADLGSVWLYDAANDELVMTVALDMEPIRLPASRGIVGQCAKSRAVINVPDCYADPRFDRSVDRRTGYRTRCLLALPLIGHDGTLIGVLQLINKLDGVFGENDVHVAETLAAQCAVAIQRTLMTRALIDAEKLDREITVAREIQMGALPRTMPPLPGYDVAGTFIPADQTGGDTFDFIPLDESRLFILLGDASGHGIGPALSATQVRAMLRVGLRLGADLDEVFRHINDQLVDDLPDDHFMTVFMGLLDANSHSLMFRAGGQGPLMHYHASRDTFDWHEPSTFPMGFMAHASLPPASSMRMEQGDIVGLISDGIYEYENPAGRQFGTQGVARIIRKHGGRPMAELVQILLSAVREHGGPVRQADDITVVLIRRLAEISSHGPTV